MRGRVFLLSVITTFLILTIAFRKHIRDLADVARTWGTFHAHLRRDPGVVFNFPPSGHREDAHDVGLAEPVPKIIHQIFLTQGRANASLAKYLPAIDSCRALHPSWAHQLWSDANGTAFIAEHYPEILPHYTAYPQNIQRANILRYALLHRFGGVYLDLDITCIVPLDDPLPSHAGAASLAHLPWLTPAAHPAGVNNAFILTRPGHPLLAHLLASVPGRDLRWGLPYVENMLSTGCMFFSEMWDAYARRLEREWATGAGRHRQRQRSRPRPRRRLGPGATAVREEGEGGDLSTPVDPADRIYVLADAEGRIETHMLRGKVTTPLFTHGGASSWHGWDAAMIVAIGKYYRTLAWLALVGLGLLVVAVWWRWKGRSAGQRRRTRLSVMALLRLERKGAENSRLMSEHT